MFFYKKKSVYLENVSCACVFPYTGAYKQEEVFYIYAYCIIWEHTHMHNSVIHNATTYFYIYIIYPLTNATTPLVAWLSLNIQLCGQRIVCFLSTSSSLKITLLQLNKKSAIRLYLTPIHIVITFSSNL